MSDCMCAFLPIRFHTVILKFIVALIFTLLTLISGSLINYATQTHGGLCWLNQPVNGDCRLTKRLFSSVRGALAWTDFLANLVFPGKMWVGVCCKTSCKHRAEPFLWWIHFCANDLIALDQGLRGLAGVPGPNGVKGDKVRALRAQFSKRQCSNIQRMSEPIISNDTKASLVRLRGIARTLTQTFLRLLYFSFKVSPSYLSEKTRHRVPDSYWPPLMVPRTSAATPTQSRRDFPSSRTRFTFSAGLQSAHVTCHNLRSGCRIIIGSPGVLRPWTYRDSNDGVFIPIALYFTGRQRPPWITWGCGEYQKYA